MTDLTAAVAANRVEMGKNRANVANNTAEIVVLRKQVISQAGSISCINNLLNQMKGAFFSLCFRVCRFILGDSEHKVHMFSSFMQVASLMVACGWPTDIAIHQTPRIASTIAMGAVQKIHPLGSVPALMDSQIAWFTKIVWLATVVKKSTLAPRTLHLSLMMW